MTNDRSTTPGCSEANGLKLGEFLFYKDDKGILRCLRHGQVWRDFLGDHAVTALFNHAISVAQSESTAIVALRRLLACMETYEGHGTPVIVDRAECYAAIAEAEMILKGAK
jgi:hypothetical protein